MSTLVAPLSTGDKGLDLALGDRGLLLVKRFEDRDSAIVLVRGSPGAGKSAMALHLALEAANHRGVAVGYACVELLPMELRALSEGLWPARGIRFVDRHAPDATNAVVTELIDHAHKLDSLAEQLDQLVERTAPSGSPVLVIDSLLRGAVLGSEASRDLVDAVCKFAVEKGAVLILVEESLGGPSPWMWSVDTVIELTNPVGADDTGERVLTIPKHRFGPCDAGPHRWMFTPTGIEVFPRAAAYLRPWVEPATRTSSSWYLEGTKRWEIQGSDHATTIAVVGNNASQVRSLAASLTPVHARDRLHLRLLTGRSTEHDLGLSIMCGERSVERELARVAAMIERHGANIIVVGDTALLALAGHAPISQWSAFLEAMRRRRKLVIVYETTSDRSVDRRTLSPLAGQCDLLIDAFQSTLNFRGQEPRVSDGNLMTEIPGVRGMNQQQLA